MAAPVTTFEIHASDPARCAAFYSETLGWKFVEHPFGDTRFWEIQTDSEHGALGRMIQRMGPPPAEDAPVMGAVITAQVDDLDAAFRRGLSVGGTEALPKFPLPGIGWAAYLKDPDQNVFGLFQPDPEAR